MLPVTKQLCHRVSHLVPFCRASLHSISVTPQTASTSLASKIASSEGLSTTFCRQSSSKDEFVSILGIKLPSHEPKPDVGPTGLGESREPQPSTWFTSVGTSTAVSNSDEPVELESAQVVVEKKKKEIDYHALPIVLVKLTKNNTRIVMTRADYAHIEVWSAGCAGFSGAKRGTNVAGHACGEMIAKRAREKGFSFCRVLIRGMGAARLDALKGLEAGGLRIVSITDETLHTSGANRPKKRRRV
eukprot:scpid91952/ scgid24035/ 30S ribosomal protein S11, chloroplastic